MSTLELIYYISGSIQHLIAPFPMVREGNIFTKGNEECTGTKHWHV